MTQMPQSLSVIHVILIITTTILNWMVVYGLLTGIGLCIYRFFGKLEMLSFQSVLLSFWVGWSAMTVYLQIWHLFAPITMLTSLPLILCSILGWIQAKHTMMYLIKRLKQNWLFIILFIGVLGFMTPHAIQGGYSYDDGLYHLQDTLWVNQYAIVPGLGNLHGRLGFNTTHTLFITMLEAFPAIIPARYVAHGSVFAAFTLFMVWGLKHVIVYRRPSLLHSFYILVYPIVVFISPQHLAAIKNDYIITILGLLIAGQILAVSHSDEILETKTIFSLILIAFVSVTIKLNIVIFAGGLILLLFLKAARRTLLLAIPLFVWTIGVWMLRGVILTGYPIFPTTIIPIDVEWRVPLENAIWELEWIRSWARQPWLTPAEVLANWEWLGSWWQTNSILIFEFTGLLILAGLSLIAIFGRYIWRRGALFIPLWWWALPVTSGLSLMYWWMTAPQIRFGWFNFWNLGVSCVQLALYRNDYFRRWTVLLLFMLCSTYALFTVRWKSLSNLNYSEASVINYDTIMTNYDLTVYTPVERDQCWLAPLPCTPYVNLNLRLRSENELQSGFIIDDPNRAE